MPGTLYIVATPIGNLEDITLRALRVLKEAADVIACEDTRQTQKLLNHFGIQKRLLSYHEHNEAARTEDLIRLLLDGKNVALVSDAGTPLISDPGYRIVHAAVENAIVVVPVPGASAMLSALTASGMPTNAFLFGGFVPQKEQARRKALEAIAEARVTTVLYESPHRILESLQAMEEVLGQRPIVVARELTKLHEEFLRGSAQEIRTLLASRPSIKGEFTIVIAPASENKDAADPVEAVAALERSGTARMDAIKAVAKRLGLPKRQVYQAVEERGSSRADKSHDSDRKSR